ncbi:MAG TPA: hypothetical protein VI914_02210 [Thermodesulfobacteriota bacterium]|nr:hypothetical protein [Thermodesulfobacteriota bacterium]
MGKMGKEVRIRITPDGKVEVDSSIFKNCKEVAEHLSKILGKVELFTEKEELDTEERIKLERSD